MSGLFFKPTSPELHHTEFFYYCLVLCNPFIRLANKVNWRVGRPYKCGDFHFNQLRDTIKPGMVILSHKKYEFTNLFIRGYWTHAAMVISEDIVVEAVSKGVIKKCLKDFISNLDDFRIIMPRHCDQEDMAKASEFVQKVVGYPYNFTFRSREDSYYCSELIYRAYLQDIQAGRAEHHFPSGFRDLNNGSIIIPQNLADYIPEWQVVELRNGN
jgi:hypothetical protein